MNEQPSKRTWKADYIAFLKLMGWTLLAAVGFLALSIPALIFLESAIGGLATLAVSFAFISFALVPFLYWLAYRL